MKQNFTVSLQLKKCKINKHGEVPIFKRITVDGKRLELATKRSINPDNWDYKLQRMKGRSEVARILNSYLDEQVNEVNNHFNIIVGGDNPITIDQFKSRFRNEDKESHSLIQVFEENNKLTKLEIGSKYSNRTATQYETTLFRLKNFVQELYRAKDIELNRLNINFIQRFEIYLRTEYGIKTNTTIKYLKQLKKVIHYSMKLGYIKHDPFYQYATAFTEVTRGYLTVEELRRIEERELKIKRLEEVRDVFVFVCYTGFSYSDLKELTPNSITKGIDGKKWIIYERRKTGVRASIRLLSPAQKIIEKYSTDTECLAFNKLLPVKSNQKLNSYLTEIADLCEINKHITMHLGRHTFATTVTLTNGVPIETVQKMLGHKNISTTQIYSKVVDSKIAEDMERVELKLQERKVNNKDMKLETAS